MAEVEFVGEVPSRKRKGGSHTDKNKKKKREPTIEILESPIAPVEVQSPAEDETAAAVQELLNELNQIQVEDYSTPLENVAAFTFDNKSSEEKEKKFDGVADKKKNEMSLDERFKKAVKSVEVFDTVEDFEKYLKGEKRKAFKSRMIYKKPESEDSDLEYGNVSPVPGVFPKLNSNLKPKKTKEDDGLARMVRLSTMFQSPGFLKDKPSPKVQPPPNKTDHMVCLRHEVRLEKRVSKGGWHYVKCPRQPCLLFCPEDSAEEYLRQVYRNVHPTICDKWETLVCFCRQPVTIRQSSSEKNPGRLYVGCSSSGKKCKFFNWTDLPLTEKYLKWFDEEKDLPQVNGNTWGEQFTEKDLQLLRAIKEKDRVVDNVVSPSVLSPPALPPPKYSDREDVWRRTLASARWGGRSDYAA